MTFNNSFQIEPKDTDKNRFIALDGEGCDIDGIHRYVLLSGMDSATGKVYTLRNESGIRTAKALDWITSLPKCLKIGYSLGYDWQMILGDLEHPLLYYLHHRGGIRLTKHRLEWLPRKLLRIDGHRWYDVFAYFQTSFVRALETWGYPDKERLARIAAGKADRGTFRIEDLDEISEYNLDELCALIWLFNRLRDCVKAADLHARQWYGPGDLAGSLLKHERVQNHLPAFDDSLGLPGYYGGRFDMARAGWVENVYSYDIHSAYPHAMRQLPSLADATIGVVERFNPDTLALWHVRWNCPPSTLYPPFPWRAHQGNILYPYQGEGYYWTPEVAAAAERLGAYISIDEGMAIFPRSTDSPFAFVPDLYSQRAALKAAGDGAHMALKLALNSLYGKLAQNIGTAGKRPPFQSFVWAGLITSHCRAMVLRATLAAPEHVLAINTDGILTDAPIDLPMTDALGDWEYTDYDRALLLQPGLYLLQNDDGTTVQAKSRGFEHTQIDWRTLTEAWDASGIMGSVVTPVTQFISLGTALNGQMDRWRTWEHNYKRIRFYPSWRFAESENLQRSYHLLPASVDGASTVYSPATMWTERDPLEELELLIKTAPRITMAKRESAQRPTLAQGTADRETIIWE